jgi:hypothetical protein
VASETGEGRSVEREGNTHLFADQHASFSEPGWDIIVVDAKAREQNLLLLARDRALAKCQADLEIKAVSTDPQRGMSLCGRFAALLDQCPKGSVVQVVDVGYPRPQSKVRLTKWMHILSTCLHEK